MEHPNIEQRNRQKKALEELPEEIREEHARLFRFGNASYIYHERAKHFEPTEEDYKEWLTALPENIQKDMMARGFKKCLGILSFTRYVNEKNDLSMDEWMKANLSDDDYAAYVKLSEGNSN